MTLEPVLYLAISKTGSPFIRVGKTTHVNINGNYDKDFWVTDDDLIAMGLNFGLIGRDDLEYIYRRRDDN